MRGVLKDLFDESVNMVNEVTAYTINSFSQLNPIVVGIGSIISFLLFPSDVYITYATVLLIMILLDIITKYYALSENNGGFWNALKKGVISSTKFWGGTRKKISSYLIIMVMIGLAHSFKSFTNAIELVATFVYMMMFLREAQSVAENLVEAGSDINWLVFFLKKKEKQIVEKHTEPDGNNNENVNLNITIDREIFKVNDEEEVVKEVIKTLEKRDKENNKGDEN